MKNLKMLREERGITQKKLSTILKCSQTLISKWEKNSREPSIDMMIDIANLFNVTVDELIGRNFAKESNDNKFIIPDKIKDLLEDIIELDDAGLSEVRAFLRGYKSGRKNEINFKM